MKKIYRRPMLVVHGGATERTQAGVRDDCLDHFGGFRWCF
jgi:hypothetical protein